MDVSTTAAADVGEGVGEDSGADEAGSVGGADDASGLGWEVMTEGWLSTAVSDGAADGALGLADGAGSETTGLGAAEGRTLGDDSTGAGDCTADDAIGAGADVSCGEGWAETGEGVVSGADEMSATDESALGEVVGEAAGADDGEEIVSGGVDD